MSAIAITSGTVKGQCGASYAFAATGALEGASALSNDKQVILSEQNIIDCSGTLDSHTHP